MGEKAARMLPGWGADRGPYFVLGPPAQLLTFGPQET